MIISHYRCFCADDGKHAKSTHDIGDGVCCVDCPSELNEAGRKLMGKYGEYVYMQKFATGELAREKLADEIHELLGDLDESESE